MKIRLAVPNDCKAIRQLSLDYSIDRFSDEISGFVDFQTPSEDEYALRINSNSFFYVAEFNGEVIGFISGYNSTQLKKLNSNNDPIKSQILLNGNNLVYIEQLAVTVQFRRRRVGSSLLAKLISVANQLWISEIFGVVSLSPKLNQSSLELLLKSGFILCDDTTVNDLTFGVYYQHLSRKYV